MLQVIDWIEGTEVNRFTRSNTNGSNTAARAVERDKAKFEAEGHFIECGYDADKNAFWLIKDCGDNCRWYRDVVGGMLASIYRDADGSDCTNGGISSKVTQVVLVGSGMPEIFEPNETRPALFVKAHMGDFIAEPEQDNPRGKYSAGGNFAYTCDSRFREAVGGHPIRIHDREWTDFDYKHMN